MRLHIKDVQPPRESPRTAKLMQQRGKKHKSLAPSNPRRKPTRPWLAVVSFWLAKRGFLLIQLARLKQKHTIIVTDRGEPKTDRRNAVKEKKRSAKQLSNTRRKPLPANRAHKTCRREAESSVYWLRSTLVFSLPPHSSQQLAECSLSCS